MSACYKYVFLVFFRGVIKFTPLLDWSPYVFDPKVYLVACQLPLFTGHRRLYVHNISISVLKSHANRSENFRERNHSLVTEDRLISKSQNGLQDDIFCKCKRQGRSQDLAAISAPSWNRLLHMNIFSENQKIT